MGPWVWSLLGPGLVALVSLVRTALRLRFLWKVYDRGGRRDLAVAGKVTASPLCALRRGRHVHDASSTCDRQVSTEQLRGEEAK
jgi:hypothetical protein